MKCKNCKHRIVYLSRSLGCGKVKYGHINNYDVSVYCCIGNCVCEDAEETTV